MNIKIVNLSDIILTDNYRKTFDDHSIKELCDSIKAVGLINPLIVREENKEYYLVSGYRRYKALELMKAPSVAIRILDSDSNIEEIQLIENCQREDVHPIEEMNMFIIMINEKNTSIKRISHLIGKPIKYINDRLNLRSLIKEVEVLFTTNVIKLDHALQFCKLKPEDQYSLMNFSVQDIDGNKTISKTTAVLKWYIETHIALKLSNALFDINSDKLNIKAGACTNCSKRSGCNRTLFNDVTDEDVCFDKNCFLEKTDIVLNEKKANLIKDGYQVIEVSNNSDLKGFIQLQSLDRLDIITDTKTIALVYRSNKIKEIGTIWYLTEPQKKVAVVAVSQEEKRQKSNLLIKYTKLLAKPIGKLIIEHDNSGIPISAIKIIAIKLFISLSYTHQEAIIKNYRWRIFVDEKEVDYKSIENGSSLIFYQNTMYYNTDKWYDLLFTISVYDTINSISENSPEIKYLDELSLNLNKNS